MSGSAGWDDRYRGFITTRAAKPYLDRDRSPSFETWLRWVGAVYLVILIGAQFAPEGPSVGILLVSLAFGIPLAVMGGTILNTFWTILKILFE